MTFHAKGLIALGLFIVSALVIGTVAMVAAMRVLLIVVMLGVFLEGATTALGGGGSALGRLWNVVRTGSKDTR